LQRAQLDIDRIEGEEIQWKIVELFKLERAPVQKARETSNSFS
jgi:hypothetical protein